MIKLLTMLEDSAVSTGVRRPATSPPLSTATVSYDYSFDGATLGHFAMFVKIGGEISYPINMRGIGNNIIAQKRTVMQSVAEEVYGEIRSWAIDVSLKSEQCNDFNYRCELQQELQQLIKMITP